MKKLFFAVSFAHLISISHANTYVVDTFGGSSLQPMIQNQLNQLPNGGNVMVYQERLIINTTPQNYRQISQLIHQIDQMPQTLTISVRVGENRSNDQNTGYGNIGIINSQVYVNGQWQNSQSQTVGNQLYQIQTLSGKPASIGLEQILQTPSVIVNGDRRAYPQVWIGSTLMSANQGISVLPTALPNGQIQVQITQANNHFENGQGVNIQASVGGQNLYSTVIVTPNQWKTIGYVNNQSQTSGNYGRNSQNLQMPIQIMVR